MTLTRVAAAVVSLAVIGLLLCPDSASAQRVIDVIERDDGGIEIVEQGANTWVFDTSVIEDPSDGVRVDVLQEGEAPEEPIGTGNEGADQATKLGVDATCDLFYGPTRGYCSRVTGSREPASRLGPSRLRPTPLVGITRPQSRISRGPNHIGLTGGYRSHLPRTSLAQSRFAVWPDPAKAPYGPPAN